MDPKHLSARTAKRILERLHHRLSKFDRSVFLNLKHFFFIIIFWRLYGLVFYLETIEVR